MGSREAFGKFEHDGTRSRIGAPQELLVSEINFRTGVASSLSVLYLSLSSPSPPLFLVAATREVDVFEGVARCIVCRENPARRCAERYCEEIERKRKTDRERRGEEERGEREKGEKRERKRERARTEKGESPALASI